MVLTIALLTSIIFYNILQVSIAAEKYIHSEMIESDYCVTIVISEQFSSEQPGEGKQQLEMLTIMYFLRLDLGYGVLQFSDAKHFLNMKDREIFIRIVSSTSCLFIFADAFSNTDVLELIGSMNDLKVREKHLDIKLSSEFDANIFENASISFDVMFQHLSSCVYD